MQKALKVYGWTVPTILSRDKVLIIRLYKALIRPILEYASTIWSPHRKFLIEAIERVQSKVTKFAFNWSSAYTYGERLTMLKLPSLKWRRLYLDVLMVHRILHGYQEMRSNFFCLYTEQSTLNLRKHRYMIYKRPFKSDIFKNHFVNRVVDTWNSLPYDLLDITEC